MTYTGKYADLILPVVEQNNIPIMRNAFGRYSTTTDQFNELTHYPQSNLIIDSGGFNVLNHGYTDYPWSVQEYHEWLSTLPTSFDWAAVMDFSCGPAFADLLSKDQRLEKTLENTIAHYNLDPDYTALPVLQGTTLNEYLQFYDRLKDHGIPTEYVGLGTVVRTANTTEIVDIERGLRANTDIEKLHGFGVKISAFKHGAVFESADSNSWNMEPSNGNVVFDGGDKLLVEERSDTSQAQQRSYRSFLEYYKYASRLQRETIAARKGRQASIDCWS